eukprot:5811485-Lingulodinium_polyedra.AAC.1
MMWSNRPVAVAARRKSHAPRAPCKHHVWCSHGTRDACDLRRAAIADGRFDHIIAHDVRNNAQ